MRGIWFGLLWTTVFVVTSGLTSIARASFLIQVEVLQRNAQNDLVLVDSRSFSDSNQDGNISISAPFTLTNYEFTSFSAVSSLNQGNRANPPEDGNLSISGVVRRLSANTQNEELRIWVTDTGFGAVPPFLEVDNATGVSFLGSSSFTYGLESFVDPLNNPFGLDPTPVASPFPDPPASVLSLETQDATRFNLTRSSEILHPIAPGVDRVSVTSRSSLFLTGAATEQVTFTGSVTTIAIPEPAAITSLLLGGAGLLILLRRRRRQ